MDKKMKVLFDFFKSLPGVVLDECIAKITFNNRDARRKFAKIKGTNKKVDFLCSIMELRVQFVENVYNIYKENIAFDDSASYEEVIESYNKDNCILNTIYIFHRCCDDEFDNKYFDRFLESDELEHTLNKDFPEHITIREDIDLKETKIMKHYIGYIEKSGTFFNFVAQCCLGEDFTKIIDYNSCEDFPKYGKFNLSYDTVNDKAHKFLSSLDDNEFYCVTLNESAFEDNYNRYDNTLMDNVQRKIDLQKLANVGTNLKTVVSNINDINIYKIATSKVSEISDNNFINGIIEITENYSDGDSVMLLNNEILYGPFSVYERAIDGIIYLKPDLGNRSSNYLLKYYDNITNVDMVTIEKQKDYYGSYISMSMVKISGKPKIKDIIPDDILISNLNNSINFETIKNNMNELGRLCKQSHILSSSLPEHIRNERINKIKTIFENFNEFNNAKRQAVKSFIDNFNFDSDDEIKLALDKVIEERPKFKEAIEASNEFLKTNKANAALSSEVEILKEENDRLKEKVDILEKQKKEQKTAGNSTTESENRLESLKAENEKLKKEESELKKNIAKSKEELVRLDVLIDDRNEEKYKLQHEIKELEGKVKSAIDKAKNEADIAFDPYVSNLMLEAAAKGKMDYDNKRFDSLEQNTEEIVTRCASVYDKDDLLKYLTSGVKKYRNYDTNDIINMYICIAQNFLTIFAGKPGTGKTSICNIISNSLGLNNLSDNSEDDLIINRYVSVSVEKGWSSKRDLIGYFNPLTKKYDKSNGKIFDALMLLNKERYKSQLPFFILLDEANLSPIECYWSEFMRVADRKEEDMFINIGEEEDIFIPKTLRFLATINSDQTTEEISPRLIDRAWVIRLPETEMNYDVELNFKDTFKDIIRWSDIEKVFIKSDSNEIDLKEQMNQIYDLFEKCNLSISPRVKQSIKNYVCVAQEIMIDGNGVSKSEKAIDYAITQKLLPKINGYYTCYQRLFDLLINICDENHLNMTKKAINDMINNKDQNMGYCKYLT